MKKIAGAFGKDNPMKILILTSKDQLYSNFVLNKLIKSGILEGKKTLVLEQDWVLPNKSRFSGFIRYLKISGAGYVLSQVVKQYLFIIMRYCSSIKNKKDSIYFPYYANELPGFLRKNLQNLKSEQTQMQIRKFRPEIILSVFSKEIMPESIINLPKYGCINIHPAPLPFYRGVSPTFWCLANKEKLAGVTLHYIDKGIDTGKIIRQRKVATKGFKTEHAVYLKCAEIGAGFIIDFLKSISKGEEIKARRLSKSGSGGYYSLPSKAAVARFHKNGYRLFSIREIIEGRN